MDEKIVSDLNKVSTLKKEDKSLNEEYQTLLRESSDNVFSVLKKSLIDNGVVQDVRFGNNDGFFDRDGLQIDICDVEVVEGQKCPRYKWLIDVSFKDGDFKFKSGPCETDKKVHKFLTRNKKNLLDEVDVSKIDKIVKIEDRRKEISGEIFSLMDEVKRLV